MPLTPQEARVVDFCTLRPVVTLAQICSALDVAPITARRALKEHGYYSSFNHNARYYTLADRPRFAANGLWFYRSIGFSRHRSLTRTLVALVEAAAAGATLEELAGLLRTPVGNLLADLARQRRLARRRLGHRVVYLAADPQRQEQQWRQRGQPEAAEATPAALPGGVPLSLVVPVLVEMIRSPQASAEKLAEALQRDGLPLRSQQAQDVVDHFRLEKKEVACRWQSSSRPWCVPGATTGSGLGLCRRPPFTPSTEWPRRRRPANRCRR
jgi:hypothetical protein